MWKNGRLFFQLKVAPLNSDHFRFILILPKGTSKHHLKDILRLNTKSFLISDQISQSNDQEKEIASVTMISFSMHSSIVRWTQQRPKSGICILSLHFRHSVFDIQDNNGQLTVSVRLRSIHVSTPNWLHDANHMQPDLPRSLISQIAIEVSSKLCWGMTFKKSLIKTLLSLQDRFFELDDVKRGDETLTSWNSQKLRRTKDEPCEFKNDYGERCRS